MRPSVRDISKAAALYFELPLDELRGRGRARRVAYPRMMAMTVAYRMCGVSMSSIGDAFGGRDHTTVLSSIRKVDSRPKMQEASDGLALVAVRICVERRALERELVHQGIHLGQIAPSRPAEAAA